MVIQICRVEMGRVAGARGETVVQTVGERPPAVTVAAPGLRWLEDHEPWRVVVQHQMERFTAAAAGN